VNRTSVINAAKCRSSELQDAPTVFYFCEDKPKLPDREQASSILSSFIKQLCEFLALRSKAYPDDILESIMRHFGPKSMEPDFEDLKEIFIRLFHYVPNTTYILDGLDALDPKDAKSILGCFRLLFCGSTTQVRSQIMILSRDQIPGYINLSTFMPGTCQISTSFNNVKDIENYIEARITDKMLDRKLTSNSQLLKEISQVLLKRSSGMYDISISGLKISLLLHRS
jgi:hypothetical protein